MVVPHTTGQPVRSMVRVPGSGIDREAMPHCLDLSNVSSLAAAVYVPNTLPKALVSLRQSATPSERTSKPTNDRQSDILGSVLERNRGVHENSGESVSTSSNKRKRTFSSEPPRCSNSSGNLGPSPKKVTENGTSQPTQLQFAPATGLAVGQAVQLLLIPGTSSVVLQMQHPQSSGIVSTAPLRAQVSTSAVQFPSVLLQQTYVSNSPVNQTCMGNVVFNVNQNAIGNIAGTVAQPVQVKQPSNHINSGSVPKGSPQTSSIEQLIQERDKLKAENVCLQSTLTKYQNLFKNRASLQKIARYVAGEAKA